MARTERVSTTPARVGRRPIVETGLTLDDAELVARTFRVLGDESRLKILDLLDRRECHQAEIVRELGLTQSRVSEHLACLVWCGFAEHTRTEGRRRYFRSKSKSARKLVDLARAHVALNEAGIANCRRVG